ncbi:hypothetical protein GIB67_015570 [Kingdonia uniflora]|uniref:Tudor domain-containing protein n=1 Tax=Kingdonia uniflora TaxID=39325 RepID=A0A7J7LUB2_9MAGN|nr:hypothetical protein GIB67_015570 [Kingdonia uniflora]
MGDRVSVTKKSTNAKMRVSDLSVDRDKKTDLIRNGVPENPKATSKKRKGPDMKIAEELPVVFLSKLRPRKNILSFRKIDFREADCRRVVGKKIKVYWPDSKKWFKGRIKSFNNKKMFHHVLYDDGDKENLDLTKEQFELEVLPSDSFILPSKLGQHTERIEISSDEDEVIGETGTHEMDNGEPAETTDDDEQNTKPAPDHEQKEMNYDAELIDGNADVDQLIKDMLISNKSNTVNKVSTLLSRKASRDKKAAEVEVKEKQLGEGVKTGEGLLSFKSQDMASDGEDISNDPDSQPAFGDCTNKSGGGTTSKSQKKTISKRGQYINRK